MKVVSTTTAVTTLLKIGREDLLSRLFGVVWIPPAVAEELRSWHGSLPPCCQIRSLTDPTRLQRLRSLADAGEAEAIGLALDIRADLLLIDDKKGRRLAQAEGVRCVGLPALLLLAKQRNLIVSVGATLELLERKGNFYLTPRVRDALLRLAGE